MGSQIHIDSWPLLPVIWVEEPPAHRLTTLLNINHSDPSANINICVANQLYPKTDAEEPAKY